MASLALDIRRGEDRPVDVFLVVDGQREVSHSRGCAPRASRDRGPTGRVLLVDIGALSRDRCRSRIAPRGPVRKVAPVSCR